jgi:GH15 family glucan-1,4-alpha-glucosidase
MMCWVALDRALRLCEAGHIPGGHASTWRGERDAIGGFIESRCWSDRLGSYTRHAGGGELDASLLLGVLLGYEGPDPGRLASTVDALWRELGRGPLLSRYSGEDGLRGSEGAFLCCSFWLADALARIGRLDEAARLMEQLIALANDVGLYTEEVDPETNELLGNIPQGLVHLALINAAVSISKASA